MGETPYDGLWYKYVVGRRGLASQKLPNSEKEFRSSHICSGVVMSFLDDLSPLIHIYVRLKKWKQIVNLLDFWKKNTKIIITYLILYAGWIKRCIKVETAFGLGFCDYPIFYWRINYLHCSWLIYFLLNSIWNLPWWKNFDDKGM